MILELPLRDSQPLIRAVATASFFFLAILFGLTLSDYLTRDSRRYIDLSGAPQEEQSHHADENAANDQRGKL